MFEIRTANWECPRVFFFKKTTVCHTKVHRFKVDFPMVMTRTRRNHLSYVTVDTWNKLASWVMEANSVNGFKRSIDKHWTMMTYLCLPSPH